jgi:hypothetical protein
MVDQKLDTIEVVISVWTTAILSMYDVSVVVVKLKPMMFHFPHAVDMSQGCRNRHYTFHCMG